MEGHLEGLRSTAGELASDDPRPVPRPSAPALNLHVVARSATKRSPSRGLHGEVEAIDRERTQVPGHGPADVRVQRLAGGGAVPDRCDDAGRSTSSPRRSASRYSAHASSSGPSGPRGDPMASKVTSPARARSHRAVALATTRLPRKTCSAWTARTTPKSLSQYPSWLRPAARAPVFVASRCLPPSDPPRGTRRSTP
jgi:hypothetical protein